MPFLEGESLRCGSAAGSTSAVLPWRGSSRKAGRPHLDGDEEITQTELAWRMSGKPRELGAQPTHTDQDRARDAVRRASAEGWIDKRRGKRNAILVVLSEGARS